MIRANSAIMKCKIPSFVSEFIYVDQWVASDGSIYTPGRAEHGRRAFIVSLMCLSVSLSYNEELLISSIYIYMRACRPLKLTDRPI